MHFHPSSSTLLKFLLYLLLLSSPNHCYLQFPFQHCKFRAHFNHRNRSLAILAECLQIWIFEWIATLDLWVADTFTPLQSGSCAYSVTWSVRVKLKPGRDKPKCAFFRRNPPLYSSKTDKRHRYYVAFTVIMIWLCIMYMAPNASTHYHYFILLYYDYCYICFLEIHFLLWSWIFVSI